MNAEARFLTGMARSGTTWLAGSLNEHSQTAVFGETLFWGRGWLEPDPDGYYGPEKIRAVTARLRKRSWGAILGCAKGRTSGEGRCIIDGILDGLDATLPGPLAPRDYFLALGSAFARHAGKPFWIEKTPHHLLWLDRIFGAYPDARVVAVLRNPYDFMLSYKHQGDRKGDEVRKKFHEAYHPLPCSLIWRRSMEAARHACRQWPGQVLIVHSENFRTAASGELERIQEFLGLRVEPLAGLPVGANTSFPGGVKPVLADEDVFWMNRIAGKMMGEYPGITVRQPSGWLRPLGSILLFPFWALRFLLLRAGSGTGPGYFFAWLRRR